MQGGVEVKSHLAAKHEGGGGGQEGELGVHVHCVACRGEVVLDKVDQHRHLVGEEVSLDLVEEEEEVREIPH